MGSTSSDLSKGINKGMSCTDMRNTDLKCAVCWEYSYTFCFTTVVCHCLLPSCTVQHCFWSNLTCLGTSAKWKHSEYHAHIENWNALTLDFPWALPPQRLTDIKPLTSFLTPLCLPAIVLFLLEASVFTQCAVQKDVSSAPRVYFQTTQICVIFLCNIWTLVWDVVYTVCKVHI